MKTEVAAGMRKPFEVGQAGRADPPVVGVREWSGLDSRPNRRDPPLPLYRTCRPVADREVNDAFARSFLRALPQELVAALRAEGERTDYPAGTTIYRAGSDPRAVLVVQGLIRVYMTSSEGRQVTVRYARPGDVLGIAVLVGGPANVDVQALAPSGLFRISARMLTAAARRDARVAWAMAEELNRRLYETLQQTAINAFGSVSQRVASHLLDLAFPGGLTGLIYDRLARFDIGEQDTLTAQLAALGYTPADVDTAILSHLHEDHIGGIAGLKDADLLVSAAEWAQLSKAAPEPRGFLRKHIQIPGLKWHHITMEPANDPSLAPFTESLDVMGDGSLVLLATPGHTKGSISLLIRRGTRPPLLLVGDLTYGAELLERRQVPGVGNRRRLAETTGKVLALKKQMPGLVVLPAHDPTAAARLLGS